MATMGHGLALIREGKVAEGLAPLKAAITFRETKRRQDA